MCVCQIRSCIIVRSPFRAKPHVVVQYMAAVLKCPLPPPPARPPLPHQRWNPLPKVGTPCPLRTAYLVEDKEDKEELVNKEELMTLPTPQGTSYCSCLEQCFIRLPRVSK